MLFKVSSSIEESEVDSSSDSESLSSEESMAVAAALMVVISLPSTLLEVIMCRFFTGLSPPFSWALVIATMSTEFSISILDFGLSWPSGAEVVGCIVTLGLLSSDAMVVSGATDVMLTEEERDSAEGRGSDKVEAIIGGVDEDVKEIPVDRLDIEVADGMGGGGVVDAETHDKGGVARPGIGGKLDKAGRLDKVAKELVVMVAEEEEEEEVVAEEEGEEEAGGGAEVEDMEVAAEPEPEPEPATDDVEAEGGNGDEMEEVQGVVHVVVVVVVEGVEGESIGGVKQVEDNREDVVVRVIVVETSEVVEA